MISNAMRQLTPTEQEQEAADFARAYKELETANGILKETLERFNRSNTLFRAVDASVDLARKEVATAEGVIHTLDRIYTRLRQQPSTNAVDMSNDEGESTDEYPISDEDIFFGVHSSQLTNARASETIITGHVESGLAAEDPSPPYTSQPGSPVANVAALAPNASQSQSQQPVDVVALLSQVVAEVRAAAPAMPSMPSRANRIAQQNVAFLTPTMPSAPSPSGGNPGIVLTSPNPNAKHYIVTKGRRTGIYRTWPEAEALTDGLPGAVYQGLRPYQLALDTYFKMRALGKVQVIRGPTDTDEQFGNAESAEDIF